MTILRTDDAELYYELHGDGPPLVLIHGASGTHLSWWQQVAELRYHYSCLIYDLRGYGRSRAKGQLDPGDCQAHVRDLASLLDHVGFGATPVNLVGASLGTAPALRFAAQHQARVARLVLCCGTGCATSPRIRAGWKKRHARMKKRYRQVAASESPLPPDVPPVRSPGEKERFAAAYHPYGPVGRAMHLDSPALTFLYAEIMASAGGPPTPTAFPAFTRRPISKKTTQRLRMPVLVVGGTEDPLFPPSELEELAALFPNARCELFAGAGHLAYYERPQRFNSLLATFLRQ